MIIFEGDLITSSTVSVCFYCLHMFTSAIALEVYYTTDASIEAFPESSLMYTKIVKQNIFNFQ